MRKTPILLVLMAAALASALDLPLALERNLFGEVGSRKSKALPDLTAEHPDNSMDPDEYRIGGGDAFQISIVDLPSHEFFPVVNPDGNLYLGDFGEIRLGNATLTEAKRIIRERMRKALKKNYEVYVTLKQVKKANVTVGGALPLPGTYQLPGTSRLYDALKQANKGLPPDMEQFDVRNVAVRNGDSVRSFDLVRFLLAGETRQNPYVYPGDHVMLRPLDRSVIVAGQLLGPVKGRIPLVEGERLGDILRFLNLKASADTGYVLLRKSGGGLRRLELPDGASTPLEDNDVITIPSVAGYGRQDTAQVTGEVERPGTYPITWGKTTAAEILEMAGGATDMASPDRAFLLRKRKLLGQPAREGEMRIAAQALRQNHPAGQQVRPEVNLSLSDLTSSNDFAFLDLSRAPDSVVLEGGDEIHMPRKERFVYLSGHVRMPGAYPYRPGAHMDDYVRAAGGYSRKADRINAFVLFQYQGHSAIRDQSSVREGDIIVVPASIENKRLTSLYLPVIQTLAAVLSLALTMVAITR